MHLWGASPDEESLNGCSVSWGRLCEAPQHGSSGLVATDFPSLVVQKTWKEAEFQWAVHSPTWKGIAISEMRGWAIGEEKYVRAKKGVDWDSLVRIADSYTNRRYLLSSGRFAPGLARNTTSASFRNLNLLLPSCVHYAVKGGYAYVSAKQ